MDTLCSRVELISTAGNTWVNSGGDAELIEESVNIQYTGDSQNLVETHIKGLQKPMKGRVFAKDLMAI